jgi:hypothetical protein
MAIERRWAGRCRRHLQVRSDPAPARTSCEQLLRSSPQSIARQTRPLAHLTPLQGSLAHSEASNCTQELMSSMTGSASTVAYSSSSACQVEGWQCGVGQRAHAAGLPRARQQAPRTCGTRALTPLHGFQNLYLTSCLSNLAQPVAPLRSFAGGHRPPCRPRVLPHL